MSEHMFDYHSPGLCAHLILDLYLLNINHGTAHRDD